MKKQRLNLLNLKYIANLMLVVFSISCSESNVSPGNQYIGTYETTVQVDELNFSAKATISFKISGGKLILTDTWGDHDLSFKDPNFTLTWHSTTGDILNQKDIYQRYGYGRFDGKNVTMTTYSTASDGGGLATKAIYTGTKK